MLGVMTVAKGSSSLRRVWIAVSSISRAPLVATMTGSTTIFVALYSFRHWAMTLMSSEEETIPIFTASGKISSNTASSCFFRNSGDASMIPVTPVVFCAVSAVIALMAYTPFIVIVLMSA